MCIRDRPIGQQNFNLAKEIIDYIDNTLKSANEKAEIPPITSEAVSYTHLDVYKRQE